MEELIQEIETRVQFLRDRGFHVMVNKYTIMGTEKIKIGFATSDKLINNVQGQYPDYISFSLSSDFELQAQHFGGSGGGTLQRKINKDDPKEQYLAMKSVKVPFKKPQQNKEAVLRAIERLVQNYVNLLASFKLDDKLLYSDLADYEKLLN